MSPRTIPEELYDAYTLDKKIQVCDLFMPSSANRNLFNYSVAEVDKFLSKVEKKESLHYPETDAWLYEALEKYSIKDHKVLIIGSEEPCYEATAIHYGADCVMMVEYQKVTSEHPKIKTLTVQEFSQDENLYDSTITISSVEHSGLGRYGDDLNPNGDIEAMKVLLDKTKVGGLCFLAVPMGVDQILWNAHRVYGRLRFPMLIEGWEVLESFGFIDSDFELDEAIRRSNGKIPNRPGISGGAHQPVFVLKKK